MRPLLIALTLLVLALPALASPQDPPPKVSVPPPLSTPGFPGAPDFARSAAQQFKDLVPTLIEALKDTDAEVRQNSAIALATLGHDALAPLKEALKDANKEKRASAAYALGQMGTTGREAVPDLLKVMKDEEAIVRRAASQAISRIVANEGSMYGFQMITPRIGPPIRGAPLLPSIPLEPVPSVPDKR